MPDAPILKKMMVQHIHLFQTPIESIGADKGYYSKENHQLVLDFGIKEVVIQRPRRRLKDPPQNPISQEAQGRLENCRAGIEPNIGHLKNTGRWDAHV